MLAVVIAAAATLGACDSADSGRQIPSQPSPLANRSGGRIAAQQAPIASVSPGAESAQASSCDSRDLLPSSFDATAGAGNEYVIYSLANAGRTTCTLAGFPRVQLVDTAGTQTTALEAAPNGTIGSARTVALAAGGVASFYLDYAPCGSFRAVPDVSAPFFLRVTIPGVSGPAVSFNVQSSGSGATQVFSASPVTSGVVAIPGINEGPDAPPTRLPTPYGQTDLKAPAG